MDNVLRKLARPGASNVVVLKLANLDELQNTVSTDSIDGKVSTATKYLLPYNDTHKRAHSSWLPFPLSGLISNESS